jgi:flagellar hook-length control protein FliK
MLNQLPAGAPILPAESEPAATTATAKPRSALRSGQIDELAAAAEAPALPVPDALPGIQPVIVAVAGQMAPKDPPPKAASSPPAIGAVQPRKAAALPVTAPHAGPPVADTAVTTPGVERLGLEQDPAVVPTPPQAILAGMALAPLTTAPVGPAATRGNGAAPVEDTTAKTASISTQIAPALVSLAGGPPGTQRLTLRLDPIELGHVQIRIDRAKDGPAEVSITVERPETLALLQRDQHQLHLALDQAGISPDGRQVTFHAAPMAEPSSSGQSSGASLDAGGSGRGQPGARGQSSQGGGTSRPDSPTPIATGWLRAGLDITA